MENKQEFMEQWISRYITEGKPPKTMYNIGVGPKSEAISLEKLYPGMDIYGCEPLIHLYPKETQKDFPGLVLGVAIGSEDGIQEINYDPNDLLDACMIGNQEKLTATESVRVMTLDHFDHFLGNPTRILLWMDIEGMELKALESGMELLGSHRVRWINLEERLPNHVPEGWCHPKDIESLLKKFGFEKTAEYNRHTEHQDVIYVNKGE
ncbi:FkbM family methyltransferase [Candidatus Pacearchaeota archaeon]|nr:FkbM family methyltransferase [Candidatus Pacearchaeota archaeon]